MREYATSLSLTKCHRGRGSLVILVAIICVLFFSFLFFSFSLFYLETIAT